LFVGEDDADGTAQAIERLCDPTVREDVITRGAAQAPKFGFADMARQVADELISTHRRTSNGEVARPNGVWQDLRETLQTSQSPKIFGVVLRQELRKRTLAMLRKFGGEPSRSRPVGVSPRAATQSGALDDNRRRVLTKKSRTLASGAPARWEVTTTLTF
jgi:hypothetical protein